MTTPTTTSGSFPSITCSLIRDVSLGGSLAGYSGLTRDAYALDLRQFVAWCDDHQLDLFEVRGAAIEAFVRELERRGRARARRLCTVTSFCRYEEEEGLLAHSPAGHERRPRIDHASHAPGPD
jgi:integrase/recombinase XerD